MHYAFVLTLLLASAENGIAFSSPFQRFAFSSSMTTRQDSVSLTPDTLTVCHMSESSQPETAVKMTKKDVTDSLNIPTNFPEMVSQAARAMNEAYDAGITRQTIRVMLPRDPSSADLGLYFESDAKLDTQNLILVPPDETWQGGIMQLYRAALPTCEEILRKFSKAPGGVPPRVVEDRSVDASGVDGVGLLMTESTDPADDVSCFIQPTQETIDAIENISNQAGKRLVAQLNPQWRNIDDALDSASKQDGFMGKFAAFLGGKGNSLRRLEELGFTDTFILEGYVCKGGNILLMKRFDSDWGVFAENDSADNFIRVGTIEVRPTYQEVDKMLDDNGISLKYARDIGLAPKL